MSATNTTPAIPDPTTPDQGWITALKRRDPTILADLFERYADALYRLAVRLLNDEQQADGVVQNTFMALINHADDFEGRASISTWLYRVAYNDAMMRVRTAKPQVDIEAFGADEIMPSSLIDWRSVPESLILSQEASTEMDRAIAALPPSMRAVFTLRDVDEFSVAETASILGITEAAVKTMLHRARLLLRESLASYFQERYHPKRIVT